MGKGKLTLALGALALSAISINGCGEDGKSPLGDLAEQCGLTCGEGIAEGNASITGFKSVDNFFAAVVRFEGVAGEVSGGIDAQLAGIQADFALTEAEVAAGGSIGGALKAKLEASLEGGISGGLRVNAEPARCEIDAQASFSASAECQVEANCECMADFEPGKAEFECKGGCTAEASAEVKCEGSIPSCTFEGPSVACEGECKGTCSVEATAMVGCSGTCEGSCTVELDVPGKCEGTCSGTCDGNTSDGVACAGTCDGSCELSGSAAASCSGSCTGECKTEASASASCSGKCSGSCTAKGADLDCTGAVSAKCEAMADASVMCNGKCDGEFEPPMAMASCECDAAAECNAQAEANAKLDVQCTPPSVSIDYELKAAVSADVDAKAQFEFAFKQLATARLPGILASLKKGELLVNASGEIVASAEGAATGIVKALGDGDLDLVASFKVADCAPAQFKAVAGVMKGATENLSASVKATGELKGAIGL